MYLPASDVTGWHVEPDPGEQAVLAEIQNLRQSGQTLRGIAAALMESKEKRSKDAWLRAAQRCYFLVGGSHRNLSS